MKKLILITISLLLGGAIYSQNYQWVSKMGGSSDDGGYDLAVDAAGNTYLVGIFSGTADFDPGNGVSNLTSAGGQDIYVVKLNSNGAFQWVKQMGGTSNEKGRNIELDNSGNIYIAGVYNGDGDYDPGTGVTTLVHSGSDTYEDVFVAKLNSSGDLLWAIGIGGTERDYVYGMDCDPSGNVYFTGYFSGTMDFDPGTGSATYSVFGGSGYDSYVCQLNSAGDFVWVKIFGGSAFQSGKNIEIDADGNIYSTGTFGNTVDFDPGPGVTNISTSNLQDIYISKLNASGDFVWVRTINGTSNGNPMAIVTDETGSVYTAGAFQGTFDFDPGSGTHNLTCSTVSNAYVSKLDMNGNFLWAQQQVSENTGSNYQPWIDSQGNLYVIGVYSGITDVDGGTGVSNMSAVGATDIFLLKLNANGSFITAKSIGGGSYDNSFALGLDAAENIYIGGNFMNTCDFDPGTAVVNQSASGASDLFVLKLGSTLSISENGLEDSIVAYPNPTTESVVIALEKSYEQVEVRVIDATGKVMSEEILEKTDKIDLRLDGEPGLYFVTIITSSSEKTLVVVKK
jgi:hypothetical protein